MTPSPSDKAEALVERWKEARREVASIKTAARSEAVAHIVEKLDGSNRRVMLVEKYDPRKPDFWVSEDRRAEYRIIPLYATAQPSPDADGDAA